MEKEQPTVSKDFLEIEVKFNADKIDRYAFKEIAKNLEPSDFLYVESTDIYYIKSDSEFLRHRASAENTKSKRSELTFKKKKNDKNNVVRTEVNLRVDHNDKNTVEAFATGLDYHYGFSLWKACDVYYYHDVNLVYYTVRDDSGKYSHFIEVEVNEDLEITEEAAWEIIRKYEKILEPLGISPQSRLRKSLFEMYKK